MKILLILILMFACNSNPTYPWYKGTLEEIKKITGSKLIMLDFYTDT